MTRARDVSRLVTTPPNIYATDTESSAGFLSLSSASTIYKGSPNRNLIINGDMQVAQRSTSVSSITSTGHYTTDRWRLGPSNMGTWTMSQENDAPTGSGFRKSTKILCTTADASPAANDHIVFVTSLEGQNVQQFLKGTSSAKQFSLSFWVKANVTGTYIANIYDNDNTRWCSASYTVSASATWEKKTITLPADTTGAFDNDNAGSLVLHMFLGAGTGLSGGTLGTTWRSADFINSDIAAGQVNLAASTNNYWQITGVQLEVGSVATEFEFLPAQVELALCQRYYEVINYAAIKAAAAATTDIWGSVYFKVTKRATPTVTIPASTNQIYNTSGALTTPAYAWQVNTPSVDSFTIYAGSSSISGYVAGTATAAIEL